MPVQWQKVVDRDSGSLAELSVDEVTYRVGFRNLRHYEVEIELEHSGDVATLGAVRAELQRQWNDLHPWHYSKYATGRALAKLLIHFDSEGLIGPSRAECIQPCWDGNGVCPG